MDQVDMTAWGRELLGKEDSGRLKRDGFVPAVLYGPGIDKNLHLKLIQKDVERALHTHSGANVLLNLKVDSDKPRTVMFKSYNRHPAKGTLEHLDLMTIVLDKLVTVDVPVHIIGKSEGVKLGGMLQQEARSLKIECLPTAIPDSIDVDVTTLDIGQSIHIKDLSLDKGLSVIDDENLTIVLVAAPVEEEEVKTAEETEAELAESFKEEGKDEDKEEEKKDEKKDEGKGK
jgi:large subunit ribosomal protein L25